MNFFTATEIANRLSVKLNAKIKTNDVQKVLESLGYVEKVGKKYIPTDKGKPYSKRGTMMKNGVGFAYYSWRETFIPEIEKAFRENL